MNFRKTIITALLIGVCVGVCANTGSENDIFGKSRKKHKKTTYSVDNKIDSIIKFSRTFLGTPYRYGGSTPRGFDCSGFMVYVFKNFSIDLPRTGTEQYHSYASVPRHNIRKGDLVFFAGRRHGKRIGHVGMVISDTIENGRFRFIHSSTQSGIVISDSDEPYYEDRYMSACRIFPYGIEVVPETPTSAKHKAKISTDDIISAIAASSSTSSSAETAVYHTVKRGETLFAIARRYGTTVDAICKLNNMDAGNIKKGQKLLIRQSEPALSAGVSDMEEEIEEEQYAEIKTSKPAKRSEAAKTAKDTKTTKDTKTAKKSDTNKSKKHGTVKHKVVRGETLYGIAKKYNTTVEKIKKDNRLKSNNLSVGQKLKIKR